MACDDVKGGEILHDEAKEASTEEAGYMEERDICSVRPVEEFWQKTGKKST